MGLWLSGGGFAQPLPSRSRLSLADLPRPFHALNLLGTDDCGGHASRLSTCLGQSSTGTCAINPCDLLQPNMFCNRTTPGTLRCQNGNVLLGGQCIACCKAKATARTTVATRKSTPKPKLPLPAMQARYFLHCQQGWQTSASSRSCSRPICQPCK